MIDALSLPDALHLYESLGLIALSFFSSLLTASLGIGGGTMLLAVMAQVVPVKAIIPVHGMVQLGSNFGRAAVMLGTVRRQYVCWFLIGSLAGALLGGNLVVSLPVGVLKIVLGIFIMYSVWGASIQGLQASRLSLSIGGALSTLLTMFVGATGPFVLASLRAFALSPQQLVATSAACLVIQHGLKVFVFGLLGFAFAPYLLLIVAMIASGFLGTLLGKNVLIRINQTTFQAGLNILLSVLALRLVYSGTSLLI